MIENSQCSGKKKVFVIGEGVVKKENLSNRKSDREFVVAKKKVFEIGEGGVKKEKFIRQKI